MIADSHAYHYARGRDLLIMECMGVSTIKPVRKYSHEIYLGLYTQGRFLEVIFEKNHV